MLNLTLTLTKELNLIWIRDIWVIPDQYLSNRCNFSSTAEVWQKDFFTCQSSSKQHLAWPYRPVLLSEVRLGVSIAGEVDG